ncbi:hypothetical protein [Lacibacter sp. H407]|uniref:hypothetical protein n=1 Tax=Lacibacter sp. H407 TaxID=3133423 RepID=UPI0030BF6EEE
MKKRSAFFDFFIYSFTSVRYLLLRGKLLQFINDLSYFGQWRFYKTSGEGILHYRIPWLVFSSISFLEKKVNKQMRVFEYGSGGSTLFFSERAAAVVSIEHNPEWYDKVASAIKDLNLLNIRYSIIEPEVTVEMAEADCTDPQNYLSCFTEYKGMRFVAYAEAIDEYADSSFDLVVVDGRARPSCIAHSIVKVKRGGMLLIDNADRQYYLQSFPELLSSNKWIPKEFQGHCPYGLTSVLYTTMLFIKN